MTSETQIVIESLDKTPVLHVIALLTELSQDEVKGAAEEIREEFDVS